MALLGIEIGGTKLQLVAGDDSARILRRLPLKVDAQAGGEGIRRQIAQNLPRLLREYSPRAIGIGFGGPIDPAHGIVRISHQIGGWNDFALKRWLNELAGKAVHVAVDNDANVAALGEALGPGNDAMRHASPLFYVTLGSGVGAGLVVDGRIYHGAVPGECELGHVRLDRTGTIVEKRCSGWAIDRRLRELATQHPQSPLAEMVQHAEPAPARALGPALQAGDPMARQVLAELADDLAFALSHAIHLLHPSTIVLGGGLALLGEVLRDAVARQLPRYLMEAFGDGPAVRLSELREDAVPVGALHLARQA